MPKLKAIFTFPMVHDTAYLIQNIYFIIALYTLNVENKYEFFIVHTKNGA